MKKAAYVIIVIIILSSPVLSVGQLFNNSIDGVYKSSLEGKFVKVNTTISSKAAITIPPIVKTLPRVTFTHLGSPENII